MTSVRLIANDPLDQLQVAAAHEVGVLPRQAACLMYGEGRVRAQLGARRWAAPARGVVVTHNGPLSVDQRMWVALFAAPPGTLLGGLTALRLGGLREFDDEGLTLVVPASTYTPSRAQLSLPGDWRVKLRWSTKLGVEDVSPHVAPPRTRPARSVVDAASERISSRRARVLVLAPVQQRMVQPQALWDALSRRGRCRNRKIIAESILDAAGGVDSLPEGDFDQICRRAGLPEPSRQVVLPRRDGRYYLDRKWARLGVCAEVHGIPHSEVRNWDNDLLRQNDIAIEGGGLLVFSSYAIRHLADRVQSQLVNMFRNRGWRG